MLELASDDQRYTMCVKTQPILVFVSFFFPAVLAFIYVNHPNEVDFTSGSKKSEAPVPKNYSHQAHSCLSFVLKSDGKICCEMVTLHFKSKIWY